VNAAKVSGLKLHAPKVDDAAVRVNLIISGEPSSWKRAGHAYSRFFDHKDNVKAKKALVKLFEQAYPKWIPIEHRRVGVQMFFQTLYDSKDADNFGKLVLDAFNGKIWNDDRQVKELYVRVNVATRTPFTQLVVYVLDVGA
jgi:Holliday junction resolvase RusA-like endonuclease